MLLAIGTFERAGDSFSRVRSRRDPSQPTNKFLLQRYAAVRMDGMSICFVARHVHLDYSFRSVALPPNERGFANCSVVAKEVAKEVDNSGIYCRHDCLIVLCKYSAICNVALLNYTDDSSLDRKCHHEKAGNRRS